MTLTGSDLGAMEALGKALGLIDGGGAFRDDWLSNPGDHLKTVLADDTQREALIDFVDTVLGGAERSSDAEGLVWLPILENDTPKLTLYAVLDVQPSYVGIGLGASISSSGTPAASVKAYVPVFRAARSGHSVASPLLIGQPGGSVHVTATISVDDGPATPGTAHLGGVTVDVLVPTGGDGEPTVDLALHGLQLPGAAQPSDVSLSLADADALGHAALQLVLGLVKAQADAVGAGPLHALAELVGLDDTGIIPAFPIEAVAMSGAPALAAWFESVMSDATARTAWLTALAELFGAGAVVADDAVHVGIGVADVALAVTVVPGPGGHPRVTPGLAATVTVDGDVRLQAVADLVTLDLATRSATAVPRLSVAAVAGHVTPGLRLLTGDPAVGAVRVGFGLDVQRRPAFVLAADDVDIGPHHFDTLDLTSPDALADALGAAVDDVLDHLLDDLGLGIATALRTLLGLTAPTGHPEVTTVPVAQLVADPLGAVREYWRALVTDHPAAMLPALQPLRDLISDATKAATDVTGTGTPADPWRLPLAGVVELQLFTDGPVLHVTVGARYVVATLGGRCTRVETTLRVGVVALDLTTGHATFCSLVEGRLAARARGADPSALFRIGDVDVRADAVGLAANWRPGAGVSVAVLAPNLAVQTDAGTVPLVLPVLGTDGSVALDAAGWDGVEQLVALLAASASAAPWLGHLTAALGWRYRGATDGPHLRLADLVADPATTLKGWLGALALEGRGTLVIALHAIARVVGGTVAAWGVVEGSGRPDDPYVVPLGPDGPATPGLAVWLLPDGPSRAATAADDDIRGWRPGQLGLEDNRLAQALADEATVATDIADLLGGRPDVASGLAALRVRWSGTDGRLVPPAADPPGVTVHRLDDVPAAALLGALDLAGTLGHAPAAAVVIVVVAAPGDDAATLRPDIAADHRADLRAAGLAPDAFAAPTAAGGDWLVLLGGRGDCVLAAGDPDGVSGQAARLRRVLDAFGTAAVTLVAAAEAGHAALRAVAEQASAGAPVTVADLVTLGTPYGPVSFTVVDDQPAADTLRLLHRLLPASDPDDPDDDDLAVGRALVEGLHGMTTADDPGRELRPPAAGISTAPVGVGVHAVFGVVADDTIGRGLTAVVAAGLCGRAQARAAAASPDVTGVRIGLLVPVPTTGTTVAIGGHALAELAGIDVTHTGIAVSTQRLVHTSLELRRLGGWLVGGPDPGRGPGPRPGHDVRWMTADVTVPLAGTAAAARLVLHEARVFDLDRERWVVTPDAARDAAVGLAGRVADTVTPLLPEVRVLLSDAMAELHHAAGASTPAVVGSAAQLLAALGVVDGRGGSVPDAVDHLLHDPAAHVAAVLADPGRLADVGTAVTALLGGGGTVALDLGVRAATVTSSGTPGAIGLLPWTITAHFTTTAPPDVTLAIGSPGTTPAGGAVLRLATAPHLTARLDWHRAGGATPHAISLWPSPDVGALTGALGYLVPAEIGRIGLGYLRDLDADARPIIDAVLDAVGLLGPAAADGTRSVVSPAGLVADPLGWFMHEGAFGSSGGLAAPKVVAFLDALKPILGVPGDPGTWELTPGVTIGADTRDGHLELSVAVATNKFTPIDATAQLVVTVNGSLTILPGAPPAPAVDVAVGPPGTPPGTRAVHLRVDGTGVAVFIRPTTGADIPLSPAPAGLGALAAEAVQQALPLVLDAVADRAGQAGAQGTAGAIVSAAGDLLGVRHDGHFDGGRLSVWAHDPVAALEAALLAPTPAALASFRSALDTILGAHGTATVVPGGITVTAHSLTLGWQPNPLAFTVGVDTDLPGVDHVTASLTVTAAGMQDLSVEVGPATIDAGMATLRPYAGFRVGLTPRGGRAVEVGLHGADHAAVAARWHLDGAGLQLVAVLGSTEATEPTQVALTLVDLLLDVVGDFVLGTAAVRSALATPVGTSTVRQVLTGPVLQPGGGNARLVAGLFDPAHALDRLLELGANLCAAEPEVTIDGRLTVGLTGRDGSAGVTLGIDGRAPLGGDDVVVWLEADTRWVQLPGNAPVAAGISVIVLDTSGATPGIAPALEIGGVGIRVGRTSGPLLDFGVTLGSIAVHGYGHIGSDAPGVGVHLELADLAVAMGGAGNGSNPVAEGVLRDSGGGANKLAPAFSPAVAVQRHGTGPVLVSLSAGDPPGPWWLQIQKGFGPVYVEQVGFGVTVEQQQLQRIALLLDGRVSLFGLAAAVDDLQLFYAVQGNGSFVDPSHWSVDLAGFAFDADLAGVTLEGGLRKFTDGAAVEYVGMLVGRFAAYGLSVFGGYATGVAPDGTSYASFFAFGAVNGPIGGPPAFFVTGIGGGLGINRALAVPTDMSKFGDFVFLKALDPSAPPDPDPMAALVAVRNAFPMQYGGIWFAAAISFTSFALVDGIAVLSVAVGDGLEVDLIGLARMALPRPELALVSIELGLLVRFSSKEGVLWVQAQLTDNSWLLDESVRLTGGYAFVTWYRGQYAGQVVLTMGGYHPDFHRDGYPLVPRLGFQWSPGDAISIKGGSYFALTSEAVMAGGRLEASAQLGPAWAHIVFGADGIVYFDPFRYELDVYAHISAGVTIDVWIGEITITISIGAELHLEGPRFHGAATFSIGPVGVTVPFGDTDENQKVYLDWPTFVDKYLEAAAPGQARAISALTGNGTRASGTDGDKQAPAPDGSANRPYVVFSEFELLVKSTVPNTSLVAGGVERGHDGAVIGISPMNVAAAGTTLTFTLTADLDPAHTDQLRSLAADVNADGAFPIGVWGPPQPDDDRKVPTGDVIKAIDGATFTATASITGTLPTPVNYYQVETGPRLPLPFVPEAAQRDAFLTDADQLSALATGVPAGDEVATARAWLARAGASNVALAAFEHDRAAPPLLGSLGEGFLRQMAGPVDKQVVRPPVPRPPDRTVHPPRALALLTADVAAPPVAAARTTVGQSGAARVAAPDLAALRARTEVAIPVQLSRQAQPAVATGATVIGVQVPLTRAARGAVSAVAGRLGGGDAADRLAGLTTLLTGGSPIGTPAAGSAGIPGGEGGDSGDGAGAPPPVAPLRPGDVAVLQLPNAGWDTDATQPRPVLGISGGPARVTALAYGGAVIAELADVTGQAAVPMGTERLAVVAGPSGRSNSTDGTGAPGGPGGVAGWHSGQQLAYIGWSTAVGSRATVHAEGTSVRRTRSRFRAGWVPGAELVEAATVVTTRFAEAVTAVAVLVDDPLGTDAARGIVLSLTGATRPSNQNGSPLPPTVVALGNRTALVYAVVPGSDPSGAPDAVAVGVATQAGWHVAGMLGSTAGVADLVDRLARHGLDSVVAPIVAPGGRLVTLGWAGQQTGQTGRPQPGGGPS